jgi:nicotinate-nucleotide adenylyltransferase
MVAAWLHWTGHADEVWLLPSFAHPFGRELAPFGRRLVLCQALGRAVGPWVRVVPIESELPTPSYTLHVLDALAQRHPEHRFRLVVGADVVEQTSKWHRWDLIESRYSPIAVGRQGYPTPPGAVDFPAVSSTDVRRRIAAGDDISALVPHAVRSELGTLYQEEG